MRAGARRPIAPSGRSSSLRSRAIHPLTSTRCASLAAAAGRTRCCAVRVGGVPPRPSRRSRCMGLRFRNRVGLGAGFDKDGVAIRGWAALGFGFVELGTVTPRPQAGQPAAAPLPAAAATRRSSTAWASTTPAPMRWRSASHAARPRSAGRLRDRRQHRPQPRHADRGGRSRTTSPPRARSPAWRTTSPSTSAVPNTPGLRDLQAAGAAPRHSSRRWRGVADGPPIAGQAVARPRPPRSDRPLVEHAGRRARRGPDPVEHHGHPRPAALAPARAGGRRAVGQPRSDAGR